MERISFEEVKEYAEEHRELPEEAYCEECGLAMVTEEEAHELEYLFHCQSGSWWGPICVDICECDV